jgi:hypothetical protein
MLRTFEASVDEQGSVRLLESVHLPASRRALVIVLDEEPALSVAETALLSELSLAHDWNRPEEDEAWSHLQQAQSS